MAHQRDFTEKRSVHNTENGLCGTTPFKEHSTVPAAVLSVVSVLASKKIVPGPQPVAASERCRRFPPEHNVDLVRVVSVKTTRTVLLRGRQSVKRTVTKSNGTDFCETQVTILRSSYWSLPNFGRSEQEHEHKAVFLFSNTIRYVS